MKNQNPSKNLHLVSYVVGVILGLAVTFFATWADLEAAYYGFDRTGGNRLSSLACPIFMTASETTNISIKLTNSTDRKVSPSIKVDISSPIAPVSIIDDTELAIGESKRLRWEIGPENIDLGRFVFARVWTYASYPLKDKESTCGVFVLPLPGKGVFYTWSMILLSLAGMGYGLMVMKQIRVPGRNGTLERSTFLVVVTILGLFVSYMGWWLAGVLVIVLALLVIIISIGYSFRTS
ncbi:MAG: hypothetical protein JNK32_12695 [Anaerolineales bacterium]|nr:hypothetical protein [Anaerolineales bacterium]